MFQTQAQFQIMQLIIINDYEFYEEMDSDHNMILFKYSAINTNNNHNHNIKKHHMIKWKQYNELLNQINTENNITTFHQV